MGSKATGHGFHLLAAHRALTKQLEEIEQTAAQGRAPGAGGQLLTPLPPELWAEVGPRLSQLETLSETIARRHAPESFSRNANRQSLNATLRWMSLLLRRLEETLEDLDPASITRKFGPFPAPGETERMTDEVASMRAELVAIQTALEDWRATPTSLVSTLNEDASEK